MAPLFHYAWSLRIMKRFAFLALAVLPTLLSAGTGTGVVTYTRPLTYTDNSPLAATDISGYVVTCQFTPTGASAAAACANFAGGSVGAVLTASTSFTIPGSGGKACFAVAATAGGVTGPASAVTAASCKVFDALAPSAPGNVTVTVTVAVQTSLPVLTTVASK